MRSVSTCVASLSVFASALLACSGGELDQPAAPLSHGPPPTAGAGGRAGAAGSGGGNPFYGGSGGASGAADRPISYASGSYLDAETHLARASTGVIAAAWIASGGKSRIGASFSTDDGKTWTKPALLAADEGRQSTDPALIASPDGSLWITWEGFVPVPDKGGSEAQIYVARAAPGETSFGPTVLVSDPADASLDKPWITVTPQGTLLVTYTSISSGATSRITAAVSQDGGKTFERFVASGENSAYRNLAFPCVSRTTGRTWITYHESSAIRLRYTDDGGLTWGGDLKVSEPKEPFAFVDPTCVGDGNDVWIAYGLAASPKMGSDATQLLTQIRLARSKDGGDTIAERLSVQDGDFPYFINPQLASSAPGVLDLVYYAGTSEGDVNGSYRHARSTDGATFAKSTAVRERVLFTGDRGSSRWLGDYTGLIGDGGKVYGVFVDNSTGYADVRFFSKLPWRLTRAARCRARRAAAPRRRDGWCSSRGRRARRTPGSHRCTSTPR